MFDLTSNIKLDSKLQKKYLILRIVLHVIFFLLAIFVAYRILFPIVPLDFSMNSPGSSKNSLVSPRMEKDGQFPEKRMVAASENFIFNANTIGQFSKAAITFTLDKKEKSIEKTLVKIQKSYQAFFYPTGKPAGFKNGTLLTTTEGEYHIVSDGMLRKFSNTEIILRLGYPKDSFITVSQQDLKYNESGSEIKDARNYPNDTLFLIDENYYQLKDQKLSPFISTNAFLSSFDATNAISKETDFLLRYPKTEVYSGFADGSLISSADSVFIISEGKSYPLANADTFIAMGFDFKNVLAVTQDEINVHVKQKQFTDNDPHPNGIIFLDQGSNKHFVIENGTKRPLENDQIAKQYALRQQPIVADLKTSGLEATCTLEKKIFFSSKYTCSSSLQNLASAIGNDYQITTNFSNEAKIKSINATFSTPLTWTSLKNSLSKIKTGALAR